MIALADWVPLRGACGGACKMLAWNLKPGIPLYTAPMSDYGRKISAGARTLVTVSPALRDSLAAAVGRALTTFTLARIAVLQADSHRREEVVGFDNDDPAEKPWQTFDNLINTEPVKGTKSPVTVTTETKLAVTALLIATADATNAYGKLPAVDAVAALSGAANREANVVSVMAGAALAAAEVLRAAPLDRDLSFLTTFRVKFEALVSAKSLVDPGASQIARMFVDFLKVVGWHAGTAAYESGHITLNRNTLFTIIASLETAVGARAAPAVRDVLSYMRDQLVRWEAAVAHAKKISSMKASASAKAPALTGRTSVGGSSAKKPSAAAKSSAAAKVLPARTIAGVLPKAKPSAKDVLAAPAVEGAATEDATAEDAAAEDTAAEDTAAEDVVAEDAAVEDVVAE